MFKKFYSLVFVSILLTNLSYAENTNPAKDKTINKTNLFRFNVFILDSTDC